MLKISISNSEEGPSTILRLSYESKIVAKQSSASDSKEDEAARTEVLDWNRNDTAFTEL